MRHRLDAPLSAWTEGGGKKMGRRRRWKKRRGRKGLWSWPGELRKKKKMYVMLLFIR